MTRAIPTLDTYVAGKLSSDGCEDFLHIDHDFIAVVDGASDKTGTRVGGRAGGWIVANAIVECLKDRNQTPADATFVQWVASTTAGIDRTLKLLGWPKDVQRPAASVIVYSRHHGEMWRVGDCHFRVDGVDFLGGKLFDDNVGDIRREVLLKAIEDGADIESLRTDDIGRRAIQGLLDLQYLHANAATSEFGYPVFNGDPIPPEFLEAPTMIPAGSFVVMCSDGFDFPHETLVETISRQRISYEKDPLRMGTDGGRASTKALSAGAERHDDQCYVSFLSVTPPTKPNQADKEAWSRMLERQARRRHLLRRFGLLDIVNHFAHRRLMRGFPKLPKN
ncbi:hypothetical protein G6L37_34705 [Agrobacterium rubi]|nr:hypothetical protein [Agrobacterium rubi]NTF23719.1 hypothetical protein [Agrobacterium rubi]